MNKSLIDYQKAEDLKNTPEPKFYQWYLDLEYLVDSNYYRDDLIIGKLLDKLAVYGKVNFALCQNFFILLDNFCLKANI
jgi:hypothetical protein